MIKQELIDKAVHLLDGVYEKSICGGNDVENYLWYIGDDLYQRLNRALGFSGDFVCTRDEFQQRARELGYINGYRWGFEYPNTGEKPNLPDGCKIQIKPTNSDYYGLSGVVDVLNTQGFFNNAPSHFKIVDERHKPADTSYLSVSEIRESKSNAENVSSLPKTNFNEGAEHFEWIANQFENVDDINAVWKLRDKLYQNRKAKAEKKRVVDAAYDEAIKAGCVDFGQWLSVIYDAGFLRMPAE